MNFFIYLLRNNDRICFRTSSSGTSKVAHAHWKLKKKNHKEKERALGKIEKKLMQNEREIEIPILR